MSVGSYLTFLQKPELTDQEQMMTIVMRLKDDLRKIAFDKLRRLYIIQKLEEEENKKPGGLGFTEEEMKDILKDYCDED